ncbi:hypothetical protein ACIRD3_37495 [Kitasatospora sp. NPDC093550]|uniref:hypothetical protein n=1 Tax=Kitasatospora sp. NPDC093550 TaxID=3364089 RepID=UPI00382B5DAB
MADMEWEHARHLFEQAVGGSGSQMLWRVVEACGATAEAAFWMCRAVASESDPEGISVDPGVLCIESNGPGSAFHQDFTIAVESEDPASAVAALTAAEPRLMCVFEDGRELSPEEAEDVWDDDRPPYSPSYAAVDTEVPCVRLDCKGGVYPQMARTALRVVADELRKAGVQQARLFSPNRSND